MVQQAAHGSSPHKASQRARNAGKPEIPVRKMGIDFSDVPRLWFFDAALPTHVVNGLSLLFPAGERFFIRSVKHYLNDLEDDALKARVRGFFGQEAHHGKEHEATFAMMRDQGLAIDDFLAWYERVGYQEVEPRCPPALRLAVTAACEHFTATLAEQALGETFLDNAHPKMRHLLRWHAAEEIEHKSVAFDVFQRVDGRYWVRAAGFVMGAGLLLWFWRRATKHLLRQETELTRDTLREQQRAMRERRQGLRRPLGRLLDYLRPGFHPDDHENGHLAHAYLSEIGRLDG